MDFIEQDNPRESVDRDIESAERDRESGEVRDLVDSENTNELDNDIDIMDIVKMAAEREDADKDAGEDMVGDPNEPQPTE